MTIEWKEEQIVEKERFTRKPYIGYFAPNGELIDFNNLLGNNGHDEWKNPVSKAFLTWVSYLVKGTSIEELKKTNTVFKTGRETIEEMVRDNEYPGIDEYVVRGYEPSYYQYNEKSMAWFLKRLDDRIHYFETLDKTDWDTKLEYELLLFFQKAYKNQTFFDTIQRKISIENPKMVKEKIKQKYKTQYDSESRDIYREYLKYELLSYAKDIYVQYLGYDSLERFHPNGRQIKIPHSYEDYDFDFLTNPRVITSSYPNPNERYFNYLCMNWAVHSIPRYDYNENTGIFEKIDFYTFYQSEKEQILEQEIESIKHLVPLKERKKYFR